MMNLATRIDITPEIRVYPAEVYALALMYCAKEDGATDAAEIVAAMLVQHRMGQLTDAELSEFCVSSIDIIQSMPGGDEAFARLQDTAEEVSQAFKKVQGGF